MIVGIATPQHVLYASVSHFARELYARKLNAKIAAIPDAFAYAYTQRIVGCFGLYRARTREKLLLETYVQNAFERVTNGYPVDRNQCAEIGTRAVTKVTGFKSSDISLALSALLLLHARQQGIAYVGFTGNRTALSLAQALGIKLTPLGKADLSEIDDVFLENWKRFFRVSQYCCVFRLDTLDDCARMLTSLKARDIHAMH